MTFAKHALSRAKPRKCPECHQSYIKTRNVQPTCGAIPCQEAYALKVAAKAAWKREKMQRAADRQKRESIKSLSQWRKEAQAAVNSYVRARDAGKPCISCGRMHEGQWHAGHYLSRGAHPELALEPLNIWRQCAPCNTHLSGNQLEFRNGLIARRGVKLVDWLEGPHEPKHYTIEDLKAIKERFNAMTKEMMNASRC